MAKTWDTPPPVVYFLFLAVATPTYFLLVEIAKRVLLRRALQRSKA